MSQTFQCTHYWILYIQMNNGVREDDNGGDFDAAANYESNMFGK